MRLDHLLSKEQRYANITIVPVDSFFFLKITLFNFQGTVMYFEKVKMLVS